MQKLLIYGVLLDFFLVFWKSVRQIYSFNFYQLSSLEELKFLI